MPTSAILAEIFIQHPEYMVISNILNKNEILNYYRYVDDTLIIYNAQKTNIGHTLNKLNSILPKIKFTIENEKQNTTDYLDITIKRLYKKLEFAIYRKPTTTNLIIPAGSKHVADTE
jgi:hypothetical protein